MSVDSRTIRAQRHGEVGAVIRRNIPVVLERWTRRVVEESPQAHRLHHEALRNDLPGLLEEIGHSLSEADEDSTCRHCRPARRHGDQRWEVGWSLTEVVRDYQLLRIVLVEFLEEVLDRPLRSREGMALGLALDEAISASVETYVQARDQVFRQAERRKDEFLAVLAHELRNPLAPVRNALQVLAMRGTDPGTVSWARELMERQVGHMTRLVDDLLELSRITRGKITLTRTRLDLGRLVGATVEDRRDGFVAKGVALTLDLPPAPLWVDCDATRLTQVVGNLLHNALKFTATGGQVVVRVAAEDDGRARICIRDTGIGIAANELGQIFDLFVQADNGDTGGGLGIGLALVKGLVNLHDGEVAALSDGPGCGAEFRVWLPTAPRPRAGEIGPAAPARTDCLRLLVIEDEPDAADSLKLLLELQGHDVTVARSGGDGLEAARRLRPDVVFCDLRMPDVSGYDVARGLRGDPATANLRLVALSGRGSRADRLRSTREGFDLHITKPFDPTRLPALLASLLDVGRNEAPA